MSTGSEFKIALDFVVMKAMKQWMSSQVVQENKCPSHRVSILERQTRIAEHILGRRPSECDITTTASNPQKRIKTRCRELHVRTHFISVHTRDVKRSMFASCGPK